eukprot:7494297-Pyramimonas_sp.AAC.1
MGYASRDGLPDAEAVTPPEVVVALLVVRAEKFALHSVHEEALATPSRALDPEGSAERGPRYNPGSCA